jgi:hypothetical protein
MLLSLSTLQIRKAQFRDNLPLPRSLNEEVVELKLELGSLIDSKAHTLTILFHYLFQLPRGNGWGHQAHSQLAFYSYHDGPIAAQVLSEAEGLRGNVTSKLLHVLAM